MKMLPLVLAGGLATLLIGKSGIVKFSIPATMRDKARAVAAVLSRNGYSGAALSLACAQAMLESGWLTNRGAKQLNNLTGIKKAGSPANAAFQKKLGVTYTPVAATGEGGTYYAVYPTIDAWAADFKRILSMSGSKGAPIASQSAAAFIERIIANGYAGSGAGPANYRSQFTSVYKRVVGYL